MDGSDDWAAVACPMPECGAEMYVIWEVAAFVDNGTLRAAEPTAPEHGSVVTWRVECVNSHVVLVPTAYLPECESTTGDGCEHDHSEESRQLWPSDWARLAALIERLRPVDEAADRG